MQMPCPTSLKFMEKNQKKHQLSTTSQAKSIWLSILLKGFTMFHFYQNKTVPGPTPPNSRQPCSFNSLAKDNFMPSLVEVSGCLRSLRPKHISDDVLKIFFGHDDNDVLKVKFIKTQHMHPYALWNTLFNTWEMFRLWMLLNINHQWSIWWWQSLKILANIWS